MREQINIAIFAIDDNRDMVDTIGEILKANNIENYHLFTDPNELLTALHDDVHICIVDYILNHKMTGLDVIKKVVERNPHCYFVMLSGQDNMEVVVDFTNSTWGGRYIEKGKGNLTIELGIVVSEIIAHIHFIDNLYSIMDRTKKQISKLKELITDDSK